MSKKISIIAVDEETLRVLKDGLSDRRVNAIHNIRITESDTIKAKWRKEIDLIKIAFDKLSNVIDMEL